MRVATSTTLLVAALAALASASVERADDVRHAAADNNVSDEKVKDALLDDKLRAAKEIDSFVTDYLVTYALGLTVAEAKAVASKARDAYDGDADARQDYRSRLGKVLDLADVLKRKLNACPSTKGKRVEDFVAGGLLKDINKKLSVMHESWECPDAPVKPSSDKKQNLLDSSFFSSGFDWKIVTMMKQGLKDNPGLVLQTVLTYLQSSGWIGKESQPMAQMAVKYLTAHPEYLDYVLHAVDYAENFFESESGKRMLKVAPRLMTADAEEAMEIFAREADYNQEAFFNMMSNGDLQESFLKQVARVLINCFNFCKKSMEDDLKMAILNGVLISNKFPPIDKKNPLKSAVGMVEKLIKLFTVSRAETNLYQEARVVADEFEKVYFRFDDFDKLTEKEVENVVGRFLGDNVVGPMRDAWLAHRHVTVVDERCAAQLACLFNAEYRHENDIVRSVVRGLTSAMTYSWTAAFDDAEMGATPEVLEEAKFYGAEFKNSCDKYAPKKLGAGDTELTDCDVIKQERQKAAAATNKDGMNLSYEHNEL